MMGDSMPDISIERVYPSNEFADIFTRYGIFDLYHDCFSKPPYEEQFDAEQVYHTFWQYVSHGILLLGRETESQRCVAFAAALPLKYERDVSLIVSQHGLNIEEYWYAADLGVASNYRRHGFANRIVTHMISEIPVSKIIMRTQEKNFASQQCNMKIGFKPIKDMRQLVQAPRTTGDVRKDNRIFLEYVKGR